MIVIVVKIYSFSNKLLSYIFILQLLALDFWWQIKHKIHIKLYAN